MLVLAALGLTGSGLASADPVRQEAVIELAGVVEEGCEEPILLTQGHAVGGYAGSSGLDPKNRAVVADGRRRPRDPSRARAS